MTREEALMKMQAVKAYMTSGSPKEIEDWRKDLQGLLDFVAEQEMEAHRKAVADVLNGFKGPDEETGEWFMKAIGSKGEEE